MLSWAFKIVTFISGINKINFVDSKNCGVIECVWCEEVVEEVPMIFWEQECKHRLIRFFDLFKSCEMFLFEKKLKLIWKYRFVPVISVTDQKQTKNPEIWLTVAEV